jgi:hypothetical protein
MPVQDSGSIAEIAWPMDIVRWRDRALSIFGKRERSRLSLVIRHLGSFICLKINRK